MADDHDKAEPDSAIASDRDRRPESRLGQIIDDRYEVVRLLGEGGMGAVYEVRHRVIGRRFAMKFLHVDAARSRSAIARFRREAEAVGRLENENVVAAVDFGTAPDGAPYLLLEYLDGEDLGAIVRRVRCLPIARAVGLVMQTCRGLNAAHAHGIIHRDLKPENLFVTVTDAGADVVKILDFGIAKLTAPQSAELTTNRGLTLGTPYYMSPEQARGSEGIDERTDIYALGVILYELLTGEKPHPGHNATAVLFHLLKQQPVRIESLRPGLPAGLGDVVHRAFAFDASERFSTAKALLEALAPYATHLDAETPSSTEAALPASERESPISTTAPQVAMPKGVGARGRQVPPTAGSPSRGRVRGVFAFGFVLLAAIAAATRATCRHDVTAPEAAAAVSDGGSGRADERGPADVHASEASSPADTRDASLDVPATSAAGPRAKLSTQPPTNATPRPAPAASASSRIVRERLYEP